MSPTGGIEETPLTAVRKKQVVSIFFYNPGVDYFFLDLGTFLIALYYKY